MLEARWIRDQGNKVVIWRIFRHAAALAEQVGCPLVWLGNFGWDAIYAPFSGRLQEQAKKAEQAYRRGDLLLRCPFDLPMDWGFPGASWSSDEPASPSPPQLRQELQCIDLPLVMVGFGGLGLPVEPSHFQGWPDHHFLMPAPGETAPLLQLQALPNLTLLPAGVRPLDLLSLCSRHLGKPGFSTFCEVMAAGVGLHVVERRDFAEVSALMKGLRDHAASLTLSRSAYLEGDWRLDRPLEKAQKGCLPVDGAAVAASAVVSLAEQTWSP